MAALSNDRQTYSKSQGVLKSMKVKAATKVYMGALAAVDATGLLLPAGDTAALLCVGRADERADNTAGADAAISCRVQEGVFKWDNSVASAVTQVDVGHVVYAEDDHTVKHAAGNACKAGTCVAIDVDGVWVKTDPVSGI